MAKEQHWNFSYPLRTLLGISLLICFWFFHDIQPFHWLCLLTILHMCDTARATVQRIEQLRHQLQSYGKAMKCRCSEMTTIATVSTNVKVKTCWATPKRGQPSLHTSTARRKLSANSKNETVLSNSLCHSTTSALSLFFFLLLLPFSFSFLIH